MISLCQLSFLGPSTSELPHAILSATRTLLEQTSSVSLHTRWARDEGLVMPGGRLSSTAY